MGAPVVRVQGVSKTYYRDETPVPVLEGIDLTNAARRKRWNPRRHAA